MPIMNADEERCFQRLCEWKARAEALMNMYDKDRAYIPAPRVEGAREMYKQLKADLDAEYKRTSSSRNREGSEAEARWYAHVIHQARVGLRAPTNSSPEKWFTYLYDVGGDFSSAVSAMRTYFAVPDSAGPGE